MKKENYKRYGGWWLTVLTLILFSGTFFQATGQQNPDKAILSSNFQGDRNFYEVQVSIQMDKASISDVFQELEKQMSLRFLYNKDIIENSGHRVDLDFPLASAAEVLMAVAEETGLRFRQINRIISVSSNELTEPEMVVEKEVQETVTGRVVDAQTGEALPGVNILIENTTTGTTTDAEGLFEIELATLEETLIVTFIGYDRKVVPVDGRTELNIELNPGVLIGDELVVVGYGVQRRATLTGSVSSIDGGQIEQVPTTNVSNKLSGRIPGLITVNPSGEPGRDGATIRIRGEHTLGDNNPLIVIDGVPNRAGGLERLNAKDIEDISVLKDASAAIYGAQAANGVILITTKRGQIGSPQFTLDFNQAINRPTRLPEMADAETYMRMRNEIDLFRGREPAFSEERIQCHAQQLDPWRCPDTNWYDETFKSLTFQTRADLGVSGGTESIRYHASIGGLTEDGFYINSATRYDQFNFRSNIDSQINDNISLRFDVSGRLEDRNFPTRSTGEIFRMIQRGKPNEIAVWPNGKPGPDIEFGMNPVVGSSPETGFDNDKHYFFQSNLSFNLEVPRVEGLSIRSTLAYDKDTRTQKVWQTPWTLYNWDGESLDENGDPLLVGSQRGFSEPRLFQESEDGEDILVNLVMDYQQDFQNHSFGGLIGTERQTFDRSFFNAFRRFFASEQIPELFAGGLEERQNSGSSSEGARQTFFTRLNYNYQSKYLLEFVGRYDGSSIFPKGNRFGFFPAVSAGWRLSEENWFNNITSFFDELKLRASWGRTGNDRIDEFQFLSTFGFGSGVVFGDGVIEADLFQTRIANPNVTWEVARQIDVGVEAVLLNNRLSVEFDVFDNERSDILSFRNASVPAIAGFTLPRENIGIVTSHGFDGSINFRDQIFENISLNIGLNLGYATNKIKDFDEAPGTPSHQRATGRPMGSQLFFRSIGVFETQEDVENYPSWPGARPGDIIFEDVNGDGIIDGRDRVRIDKTGLPKWTGGLNFDVQYKSFDLNTFFQGAAGAVQYIFMESGEIGNFLNEFAQNRWTPENPNSEHPRTYNRNEEYWASNQNTHFLRNADYIRLKSVELGYTLPPSTINRLGIQNMRLYLSGFNLLTWDSMKVVDPESRNTQGRQFPQKKTFNVGISLTF